MSALPVCALLLLLAIYGMHGGGELNGATKGESFRLNEVDAAISLATSTENFSP